MPLAAGSDGALRGAIVRSNPLAAVFAGDDAYSIVTADVPRFAARVVAGVIGPWLVAAPLIHDVGAATVGARTTGMPLAMTAGCTAFGAVESGVPGSDSDSGSVPAAADEFDD